VLTAGTFVWRDLDGYPTETGRRPHIAQGRRFKVDGRDGEFYDNQPEMVAFREMVTIRPAVAERCLDDGLASFCPSGLRQDICFLFGAFWFTARTSFNS
jgi:hypothetical protein